ncbi:MAG: hypothetical protein K0S68_701 [Candidatus Saccharibacteria bacterium]|nr:hypothetical protein [Candidatus Saccharibacteria bacterium]
MATIVIGVGAGLAILSTQNPIPEQLRAAAKYPVYYPSKLPAGYKYEKNSAVIKKGTLFYRIRNGKEAISIAQQAKTASADKIKSIKGFDQQKYDAGKAFVRSSGKPSIVVLADGTLVNVGGSSDATRAAAEAMAKSLARVN